MSSCLNLRFCASLLVIWFAPVLHLNGATFDDYFTHFKPFVTARNPWIPPDSALELGATDWGLAEGNYLLARRLICFQAVESGLKVNAWMPDRPAKDSWPRFDAGGSHLALLAKEAHILGLIPDGKRWKYSDDMDEIEEITQADPCLGTFITCRAYVRLVKRLQKSFNVRTKTATPITMDELNLASHCWQTGELLEFIDPTTDDYLKNITACERLFDRIDRGAPPHGVAPNSSRRKKK